MKVFVVVKNVDGVVTPVEGYMNSDQANKKCDKMDDAIGMLDIRNYSVYVVPIEIIDTL